MECYYGVTRSPEYLAHYGVRGMKWGVRRALKKNDTRKLAYHYQRALLKKHGLEEKTNRKMQKDLAKSGAKAAALMLGTGAASGLASTRASKMKSNLMGLSALSTAGGLAALGSSGVSAAYATKRGHKKAVDRYKKFGTEMNNTFSKSMRKRINRYIKAHPEEDMFYGTRYRRRG